jgi:1-acyl-sn-glycerol-3-phosphate acyltransferase
MLNQGLRTQPRTLLQIISQLILALFGWKAVGQKPHQSKYLIIGAHHTSGWDFPLTLLVSGAAGIPLHWIGKESLFRGPLGWFFRLLGGIPVNRHERTNFVQKVIERYNQSDELSIAISPEGTRQQTSHWRTGFYYIAHGAHIPILLAFLDYPSRTGGFGPLIHTSGDIVADLAKIAKYYEGVTGLHPEKQGRIELRPEPDTAVPAESDEA